VTAAIADHDADDATIPRREGAIPCRDDHPHDAIVRDIAGKGSAGWKNDSGYPRRSLAENMMPRLKPLDDSPTSRSFERQVSEGHVRAVIINAFTYPGMAQSVRVGKISPAA